jgi:hypothetical protein
VDKLDMMSIFESSFSCLQMMYRQLMLGYHHLIDQAIQQDLKLHSIRTYYIFSNQILEG